MKADACNMRLPGLDDGNIENLRPGRCNTAYRVSDLDSSYRTSFSLDMGFLEETEEGKNGCLKVLTLAVIMRQKPMLSCDWACEAGISVTPVVNNVERQLQVCFLGYRVRI